MSTAIRTTIAILAMGMVCFAVVSQAEEIFYDSFEDPVVAGQTSTTDPTGWVDVSPNGNRCGLGYLTGSGYSNFDGHQAAWFNVYNTTPVLETTTDILDANLAADTLYVLTFNAAANSSAYTLVAELLAGDTVVLTAQRQASSTNFAENVAANSVLVAAGDPGIGEALKLRLRVTTSGYPWNAQAYIDNLSLQAISSSTDTTPPTPDPMTWVQPPTPAGDNGMYMVCSEASDPFFVEYMFVNTVNGNNSGWIDVPIWRDSGLTDGVTYTYRVKARDKSVNHNETGWSTEESAVADSQIMFYDSFEYPMVAGQTSTTDPTGWADASTKGNRCGLGDLTGTGYANFAGHQAAWFNVYNTTPVLETTTDILDANLAADTRYEITFNAARSAATNYTLVAELLAGDTVVLTAQTQPGSTNFAGSVASNAVLVNVDDPGVGEALKIRLRATGGEWNKQAYIDNLTLKAVHSSTDTTPPTPDPMTWVQPPTPAGNNGMYMVCSEASDPFFVEYMFVNTVNGNNSGWIDVPIWRDSGLTDAVTYSYKVKARDKSVNHNETGWSTEESAVADSQIMFYDSFEYPMVAGQTNTTDPAGWADASTRGNRCGLGDLTGTGYANFAGHQAAWFNVYNATPVLETTTEILDDTLVAGGEYTITFNAAANNSSYTLFADLLAGDTVVLTAQRQGSSANFAANVTSNTVLVNTGDPGVGEALKLRLRVTGGSWNTQAYIDNLTLRAILPSIVNPDVSTVVASPTSVPADGVSTSTITVTLKNADGNAVADRDVTLANTAGPGMAVIMPATPVTTNADGVATFTVSSTTVGTEVFTATDITDDDNNIVITQTASVTFSIVAQTSLIPGYTPPAPPAPDAPQTSLATTTAPPPEPNAQAVPETSEPPEPLETVVTGPIRVTEYYLTEGDFADTAATVVLDQDLAADYFILVRGSRAGNGLSMPDNDYARVAAVPGGRGGLADSGAADAIGLQRAAAAFDWEGVVTVVECTVPDSPAGFRLVDAVVATLSGTSGSQICAPWGDASRVVPFGGYRGGGVELTGGAANRYQGTSVHVRLSTSGNDTLDWQRDPGGEILADATMTTFVVEWGADWTVQHAAVAGSAGGDGVDGTGDYTTAGIDPVARANTWVWGTGIRADSGIGTCAESCVVTLGDGVNLNDTESTVAVGSEYTDAYSFDVYALTHPELAVDHRFKPDGDLKGLDIPLAVDAAPPGARFAWLYNACNGTSSRFPRPRIWSRYTADETITVSRGYDGAQFPAWIQGIDFSALSE